MSLDYNTVNPKRCLPALDDKKMRGEWEMPPWVNMVVTEHAFAFLQFGPWDHKVEKRTNFMMFSCVHIGIKTLASIHVQTHKYTQTSNEINLFFLKKVR